MAFRLGNNALKFKSLVKSELLWREIPMKYDYSFRINKYKETLNDITNANKNEFASLLYFPLNTFSKYPSYVVKDLIKDSLEIFQQKNIMDSVETYNCVLKSYIENQLSFEVKGLLYEMNEKKIKFDDETYRLLIRHYCQHGQMINAEVLFKSMKSTNDKLNQTTKMKIIKGYIIAGQPEKSDEFIRENNLNEKGLAVLMSKAKGYASLGNVEMVIDIIDQMKQENFEPYENVYLIFYQRLAKANVPEPDLEQLLDRVLDPVNTDIYNTILTLNRTGLFNCSLKLLDRFHDKLTDRNIASNLATSFNSKHCPVVKYKNALTILIDHIHSERQKHLFSNISFGDAIKFSQTVINDNNGRTVLPSLINRAIQEKSVEFIRETLRFGFDNMRWINLNLVMVIDFVPALLRSGMAPLGCGDVLDMLPEFRRFLLPVVLMHCLGNGNFTEYNELLATETAHTDGTVGDTRQFVIGTRPLAVAIVRQLDWPQIQRLAVEAGKFFSPALMNNLLGSITIQRSIVASTGGSVDGIAEAIALAEQFRVTFTGSSIDFLMRSVRDEHKQLLQSLTAMIAEPRRRTAEDDSKFQYRKSKK